MGRISSTTNYTKQGKVEVMFLDGGRPMPVWASGHIDREPSVGDMVIIGYAEGRKDTPYVVSFIRNSSMTANYIHIKKGSIVFQLPKDAKDEEGRMLEDANKAGRPYIEMTQDKMVFHHPKAIEFSSDGTITANGEDLKVDI
jgi:hypothetical protein